MTFLVVQNLPNFDIAFCDCKQIGNLRVFVFFVQCLLDQLKVEKKLSENLSELLHRLFPDSHVNQDNVVCSFIENTQILHTKCYMFTSSSWLLGIIVLP
jgi:hypothetical protein